MRSAIEIANEWRGVRVGGLATALADDFTEARLEVVRRLREMAKGHPDRVYGTIAMAELRALSFAADQLEAEIRKAGG